MDRLRWMLWLWLLLTRRGIVRVSSTSKSTIVFLRGRWSSGGYTAAASVMLAVVEDIPYAFGRQSMREERINTLLEGSVVGFR